MDCVHGRCNPEGGACTCDGVRYGGENCEIDKFYKRLLFLRNNHDPSTSMPRDYNITEQFWNGEECAFE